MSVLVEEDRKGENNEKNRPSSSSITIHATIIASVPIIAGAIDDAVVDIDVDNDDDDDTYEEEKRKRIHHEAVIDG